MAVTFSDGQVGSTMETASNLSAWTAQSTNGGSTIAVSTDIAKEGSNCAKAAALQQANDWAYTYKSISKTEQYIRYYVRMPVVFDGNDVRNLGGFYHSSAWIAFATRNQSTSKWGIHNAITSATTYESGTSTFSANTWYCVELYVKVSATVGVLQLWVDGTLKVDLSGQNTGSSNIGLAIVGCGIDGTNEAAARIVYVDSVVVSDTYVGPLLTGGTKTFTIDALLQAEQTKTFTFDAQLLAESLSKTFTFDAELIGTGNKGFTFDSLLQKEITKTFTIDALLQQSLTKTFTFDGILYVEQTQAFTFDVLLQQSLTKQFTFDAQLLGQKIKEFTFNAVLQSTTTKQFTFDSWLLEQISKTFTFDTVLQIAEIDVPSPEAQRQIVSSGLFTAPQFPLVLGLTLQGKLVWVFPIPLKKENS